METYFNRDQKLIIGFLRSIRLDIIQNPKHNDRYYDFVPRRVIHYTLCHYYRRHNFLILSSGSSESQEPKYNGFHLIPFGSIYEQRDNIQFESVQYLLKLHNWNKSPSKLKKESKKKKPKLKTSTSRKSVALHPKPTLTATHSVPQKSRVKSKSPSPRSKTPRSRDQAPNFQSLRMSSQPVRARSPGLSVSPRTASPKSPKGRASLKRANSMFVSKPKKLKAVNASTAITNDAIFDRYSYGQCTISSLELPHWGWLKKKRKYCNEYGRYHLLFRCGGIEAEQDEHSDSVDLILFNSANCNQRSSRQKVVIDAFHCKLPSFRKTEEAPFVIYNERRSSLMAFGGYHDGHAQRNINECCLDVDKETDMKWQSVPNKRHFVQLTKARYNTNVCDIGNSRYLVMGGTSQKGKPMKSCEIYIDSETAKTVNKKAADLNCKRSGLSSNYISQTNRVIVAGGMLYGKGSTQIELYDIKKNTWSLHGAKFNFEHKYPVVWTDFNNPNICYVAGDWIGFGGRKESLGFVEWIDLRVGQQKWDMFSERSLTDMFGIECVRANIWESRSLALF